MFSYVQAVLIKIACRICPHRLKHTGEAGLMSVNVSCHHGPAADKHGGHIDPGCRHQKSRHIFVTGRHHDQSIKLMRQRHSFRRICDQISGDQGVFHSHMPHGNAVAHGNRREHNRSSPRHGYALLHGCHNLVQVHMTRYDFVIRACNTNQRPLHLLLGHPQGIKKRTVRRLLGAFLYCVTSL